MSSSGQEIKKFFKILEYSIKSGIDNGLYIFSKKIVESIIEDSKAPKHGRIYFIVNGKRGKKHRSGYFHVSSKENEESAATLSGNLNANRKFFVKSQKAIVGVKSKIDYSDFIENTRQDTLRAYVKLQDTLADDVLDGIFNNINRNLNNTEIK